MFTKKISGFPEKTWQQQFYFISDNFCGMRNVLRVPVMNLECLHSKQGLSVVCKPVAPFQFYATILFSCFFLRWFTHSKLEFRMT